MHPDLSAAKQFLYDPNGWIIEEFSLERESQEYGASKFRINEKRILFRVAKITPVKVGQFVTLWKRVGSGPIQPLDLADPFDLLIISVRSSKHFGQFVFPKPLLYQQGVLSKEGQGGKRAMRLYPSWDVTDNKQAVRTQRWQLPYFFQILPEIEPKGDRLKQLVEN